MKPLVGVFEPHILGLNPIWRVRYSLKNFETHCKLNIDEAFTKGESGVKPIPG